MIELRVANPRDLDRQFLRVLDPKAVAFAEVEALNRTAANVQTLALELVSEDMGIPKSKLRKRGRGARAGAKFGTVSKGRKARARRLSTSVSGYGRPFNVTRWKAEEVREGASTSLKGRKRKGKGGVLGVTHNAYGRTQFTRNAWIAPWPGNPVILRKGDKLKGVFGPGVAQVLEKRKNLRRLETTATTRFEQHFASRLQFAFSRGGTRVVHRGRG